jgi:peptidoglycan/LPS O-acetylase OafA/YrhL
MTLMTATLRGMPAAAGDSEAESATRSYLPALDGIRGLAILLVMLHHFTPDTPYAWGLGGATAEAPYGRWAGAWPVIRWFHVGWVGVDLFFVLSGFLITRILLDTRGKPGYFRNFFARRCLRIFPLYYGVLGALFIVLPAAIALTGMQPRLAAALGEQYRQYESNQAHQAWLWFYAANLGNVLGGLTWGHLGHFWSLAVEEHFYLVWPLLVALAPRWMLGWLCILCFAAAPAVRAGMLACGVPYYDTYVFSACRIDSLTLGGLLALASVGGMSAHWLVRYRTLGVLVLLSALISLFGIQGSPGRDSPWMAVFGHSVLAALSAALVIVGIHAEPARGFGRLLLQPWLIRLGKYSYGLYVLHRLVLFPLRRVVSLDRLDSSVGSPLTALLMFHIIGITAALVVAVVSWHLYESRFLRLKRYFA